MSLRPILLLALLATVAPAQTVIESFESMTVYGAGNSFGSGNIEISPWQFTERGDFIRFEPVNGGDPTFDGNITFRNFQGLRFDAFDAIELTARTYEETPSDALLWFYLVGADYNTMLGWSISASEFFGDSPTTIRFDFATSENWGLADGATIQNLHIQTSSGDTPFRMEFHELVGISAIPEPSAFAALFGIAALTVALKRQGRRRTRSAPNR